MSSAQIVQKLWYYCNILRDDCHMASTSSN